MEENKLKKCPKCEAFMIEQVNKQLLDSSNNKRIVEYVCTCGCKITESQDYSSNKSLLME